MPVVRAANELSADEREARDLIGECLIVQRDATTYEAVAACYEEAERRVVRARRKRP